MSHTGPLLTPDRIRAVLEEVGDRLESRRHRADIVIVGGSFLALHGWRSEGTRDVDSVTRLDEVLREAAAVVAGRYGFTVDWINERARPFVPATFDPALCEVLLEHGGLRVLGPPAEVVFLMKLMASRPGQDRRDMVAL